MTALSQSLRYSSYYGAVFLALGVYLPFWPLWLDSQGLTASQIGLVLAVASWARVVGTPLVGRLADASGRTHATMVGLAIASAALFALFFGVSGFWAILILHLAWALAFNPLIPLGESRAMAAVRSAGLDYGRMRLWGSLTFILGSLAAGEAIDWQGPGAVLILVLLALLASVVAAIALPRAVAARPATGAPRWRSLLADRGFLLFLMAAGLMQASHAAYYGFSALHWRAAGLGEVAIGWLWAEGVIAEILLFVVAARLIARLGPLRLFMLAGAAGVLRWTLLWATSEPALLIVAQALHALTFGAAHLGAMHFIAARTPEGLSASAQTLYSAFSGGLMMGASLWLSGRIYAAEGATAFLVMAGLSAAGLLSALLLSRFGDG